MSEGSINRVELLGRLGRDAEASFTGAGAGMIKFSVATTRRWKDKNGEWKEDTDWHNILKWGDPGPLSDRLTKGTRVMVIGQLRTSHYENRDGQKVYKTEVVADEVILLGQGGMEAAVRASTPVSGPRPPQRPAGQPRPIYQKQGSQGSFEDDEDVPF